MWVDYCRLHRSAVGQKDSFASAVDQTFWRPFHCGKRPSYVDSVDILYAREKKLLATDSKTFGRSPIVRDVHLGQGLPAPSHKVIKCSNASATALRLTELLSTAFELHLNLVVRPEIE